MSLADEDDAVVRLSCCSGGESSTPQRHVISTWTVENVRQHIFFLVWVCGLPVHVRYVIHVLQRSAEAGAVAASRDVTAVAQRVVLAAVCERGQRVAAALGTWRATAGITATTTSSWSLLVPLGVAEVSVNAPPDTDDSSNAAAVTPVAVVPAPDFANVTALALYAPAEASSRAASSCTPPVDPVWCAKAYWTAVVHAQQWMECHPAEGGSGVVTQPLWGGAPPPTLVPSTAVASATRQGVPQRAGVHAAALAVEPVIVDTDEDSVGQHSMGPAPTAARTRTASSENDVIVIDSDDDERCSSASDF